ncbi:hypothetical protein ANO11243_076090 [Dothideomycetidae sp. 11243]|nr:hypothetical protein ANO11243_076090 [fungal sp. No.11243]
MHPPDLQVRLLTADETRDPQVISCCVKIINDVYREAEEGIWRPGIVRMDEPEMKRWCDANEVCVAVTNSDNQQLKIVGVMRVRKLSEREVEFGPLAVLPAHRRGGLGRRLVEYAENLAKSTGAGRTSMRMLIPRTRPHEGKQVLRKWYEAQGYRFVQQKPVAPSMEHRYDGPHDFVEMAKGL